MERGNLRWIDLDKKSKLLTHLSNNGNVYELKVGNVNIEMDYSKNGKWIDECMLNILKQKYKKGWLFRKSTLHYR